MNSIWRCGVCGQRQRRASAGIGTSANKRDSISLSLAAPDISGVASRRLRSAAEAFSHRAATAAASSINKG